MKVTTPKPRDRFYELLHTYAIRRGVVYTALCSTVICTIIATRPTGAPPAGSLEGPKPIYKFVRGLHSATPVIEKSLKIHLGIGNGQAVMLVTTTRVPTMAVISLTSSISDVRTEEPPRRCPQGLTTIRLANPYRPFGETHLFRMSSASDTRLYYNPLSFIGPMMNIGIDN